MITSRQLLALTLLAPLAAIAEVPTWPLLQLQARTNLIVNDNGFNLPPGASFNSVTVDMNDAAQVTFRVQVVPGRDGMSIWFGSDGAGQLVCNAEDNEDALVSDPKLNDAAAIVYGQVFGTLNGVYACDRTSGGVTRLTAGPLGASGWGTPEINDAGEIGWRAGFSGGNAWVSFLSGAFAIHATEQAIDVGSPYNFLYTPSFDNLRRIAGKVRVAAVVPLPEHHQIRLFTSDGSSTLIALDQPGSAASPYASFNGYNSVAVNDAGQVAFAANLVGGGTAVVRSNGMSTSEIAREGVAGVIDIEFFAPAINADGLVAFRGTDANGQAIFVGDGTTLRRVVGSGDLVPSDLGTAQIGQNDSSPVFGGGVAINASGDVAFTAALHPPGDNQVEWGTGVYVAYADVDLVFRDSFD